MSHNECAAELRRLIGANGLYSLEEDRLLEAMREDVAFGADLINVLVTSDLAAKNTYLVITSDSVAAVRTGMFRTQVVWSVPLAEITDVYPVRGASGRFIRNTLRIEAQSGAQEFRFGFADPNDVH
jgi:hypothetical protein